MTAGSRSRREQARAWRFRRCPIPSILTYVSLIVERFRRIHRDQPDRPLVHLPADDRTLTASDIYDAAIVHANALRRQRLGGTLVILAVGNRPSAFPFWLACRQEQVSVMLADVGVTAVEIAELARRFGASAVILRGLECRRFVDRNRGALR